MRQQKDKKFVKKFVRSLSQFSIAALFAVGLSTALPSSAHAESGGPFGLGIILGEPDGITFQYKLSHTGAVDGGLAYSLGKYMIVYGDYLFRFPSGFGHSSRFVSQMTPYVGVGGVLGASTSSTTNGGARLGLRIPLGIEWMPSRPPLGVFVELAPGLAFLPSTDGLLMGGIGVRYYF